MDGRELLAWNLRKLRVERELSQEKLATDAGLARGYFGGLERGEENASIDVLDKLSHVLAVEIADLFRLPSEGEEPAQALRRGRKPRDDSRRGRARLKLRAMAFESSEKD